MMMFHKREIAYSWTVPGTNHVVSLKLSCIFKKYLNFSCQNIHINILHLLLHIKKDCFIIRLTFRLLIHVPICLYHESFMKSVNSIE